MPNALTARGTRLADIEQDLEKLEAVAASTIVHAGRRLLEVRRDELWHEDGSRSFTDWLQKKTRFSRASAYKAMDVAEHFTPEMAERFGPEKLWAGLRYVDATGAEEQPGDLVALRVRIRGRDGTWKSIPFTEASTREIHDAVSILKATTSGRENDLPDDLENRIAQLAERLPAAPKGTSRGQRAKIRRGRDGRLALDLKGIPLDEIETVLEVVRAELAGVVEVVDPAE